MRTTMIRNLAFCAGILVWVMLRPTAFPADTSSNEAARELRFPIAGNPPLTLEMVQTATNFFEWLLDASLTVEQREQFRDSLAQSWLSGRQDEIQSTVNVIQFAGQLSTKTPQEQKAYREVLQAKFLAQMRTQPDSVLSRWVLNIYDSAHKSIAPGNPPLTQQVVDAYAEVVSFMLQQSIGGKYYNPDRSFKDALARSLIAHYPQLSAGEQVSMAQIPLEWALLQAEWPKIPETGRVKLREQWKTALQPILNESSQASSTAGDSSPSGSLDQQLHKEAQTFWVNSLSQSYMTRTTNIILSHNPFSR